MELINEIKGCQIGLQIIIQKFFCIIINYQHSDYIQAAVKMLIYCNNKNNINVHFKSWNETFTERNSCSLSSDPTRPKLAVQEAHPTAGISTLTTLNVKHLFIYCA